MTLLAALVASGCGSGASFTASPRLAREPATPRGLAAAVLEHLDEDQVIGVSGSGDGGLSVMITTRRSSVRTVHVVVAPARSKHATRQCGVDSGYIEVECRDARGLYEVVQRAGGDVEMPALIVGNHSRCDQLPRRHDGVW